MTINLNPLRGIFGLPPSTYVSDTMIINSMPIMQIIPCKPEYDTGMTIFRVDPDWETYKTILKNHGFTLSQTPLKFAYIADNFPTDTFTNEYGESFLQSFTDVASSGVQQIVQMSGEREMTAAMKTIGAKIKDMGAAVGEGVVGDVIGSAGSAAEGMANQLIKFKGHLESKGMKDMVATVDRLLGGARVDFPQIWKNSGYTPSYTATIRLYNPMPGNINSTRHHIIGPLAALLCLAVPRSQDGKTYNWPFFHKIKTPGVYGLDPAVITNITVVKGGDQQQISFNKRLAILDVRMDFTSVYSSMVLEEGESDKFTTRPTVRKYLGSLEENTTDEYYTRVEMQTESGKMAGANLSSSGNSIQVAGISKDGPYRKEYLERNEAIQRRLKAVTVTDTQGNSRVSPTLVSIDQSIRSQGPGGFYS